MRLLQGTHFGMVLKGHPATNFRGSPGKTAPICIYIYIYYVGVIALIEVPPFLLGLWSKNKPPEFSLRALVEAWCPFQLQQTKGQTARARCFLGSKSHLGACQEPLVGTQGIVQRLGRFRRYNPRYGMELDTN